MESLSDDDIELLRQTPGEESKDNSAFGYSDIDSNLNPLDFIKRGSSPGDSIDPASIHALQTAFSSLQKKHNEEVKKTKELLHANKVMKKALMDATQGSQGQFQNMDEFGQDASVVHAAGGTSEDESLAESRAKQGYCQHLQRELLIANNTIQRGNEEIGRLKISKEELEREKTKYLKKVDELHSEMDLIKEALNESEEDRRRKDLEVSQMKNAVQSEQELNHNLRLKIESLQEQLEAGHRNGVTGQSEIQNLKSKLDTAVKEVQKSVCQYQELHKQFQESEKKVAILEAKCKQYEIEVNIKRKQQHEKMEDFDDVDGEVLVLERALRLLSSQRDEVLDLKQKISEQRHIISTIQSTGKRIPGTGKLDSSLILREVQGSSFHPHYLEEQRHVYANYPNPEMQSRHSPLSRRSSDRGDYRGSDKVPRTSPRVNDNILPTGNQNVTPMLAMETNQHPKRMEIAGTVEPGARTRSPGENIVDARYGNNVKSGSPGNAFSRTSVSGNQSAYAQQSPRNTLSPRMGNVYEPYDSAFVESPRTRENVRSPNMFDNRALVETNTQDLAYIQTGARPRVPTGSANYSSQYSNSQEPTSPTLRQKSHQIPDRMTQSDIIVRDRQADNNPMTRSVLEPLQPLEIPTSNNTRQSEYVLSETEGVGQHIPQRSASEHTYQNQYREQYNGPDYENIYNANAQTEKKRQVEEHDDTVFVTANRDFDNVIRPVQNISRPVQEEIGEGNVSAVKICPVCNEEFSRLTLDQFQMHVFECFDNCDESPATLQPAAGGTASDDDRHCPMCGDVFPVTISQETYEQHVLAHFGEDPLVERFELLQP